MGTRADAAPVLIEVAGAPGAGKTALLPAVVRACEDAGLQPYTVTEAARTFARRTSAGGLAAHLPPAVRRRALWAIFRVGRLVGAARLAGRHPGLAARVAATQWRRPAQADARRRRVLHWYVRTAGAWEYLRRLGRPGEAVIFDEGLVHRVVQLHTSAVERPDRRRTGRYVRALPAADLLVVVRAPVQACRDRVRARGVWPRLAHRGSDEIDGFVTNAHRAVDQASAAARALGRALVEVDNDGDLRAAQDVLRARVRQALARTRPAAAAGTTRAAAGAAAGTAVGAAGGAAPAAAGTAVGAAAPAAAATATLPRLRVPRVARLRGELDARRRPPTIAPRTCAQVLAHYGLAPAGPPRNVASGRRNHTVVVATPAGPQVLRRYRRGARAGSVAHEHAVLTELERHDFPAVRLRRTRGGDTVVAHDGDLYALFAYEHGANLSSCVLPAPGARAAILAAAGRTLADLHGALAGYDPPGAHHLGYDVAGGGRIHDLGWYLDALATLPRRAAQAGPTGQAHHQALAAEAPAVARWLAQLHEALAGAALPTVMIHGDYGVHNLLFRRDGVAVVADFELARHEWRLVDLVIVLSRMPDARGRVLLDSYRQATDLPREEWARLPEVWQYHRLTGAVQSWSNHFTLGGERRLATAQARLAEARWARTQVAALWA